MGRSRNGASIALLNVKVKRGGVCTITVQIGKSRFDARSHQMDGHWRSAPQDTPQEKPANKPAAYQAWHNEQHEPWPQCGNKPHAPLGTGGDDYYIAASLRSHRTVEYLYKPW